MGWALRGGWRKGGLEVDDEEKDKGKRDYGHTKLKGIREVVLILVGR